MFREIQDPRKWRKKAIAGPASVTECQVAQHVIWNGLKSLANAKFD